MYVLLNKQHLKKKKGGASADNPLPREARTGDIDAIGTHDSPGNAPRPATSFSSPPSLSFPSSFPGFIYESRLNRTNVGIGPRRRLNERPGHDDHQIGSGKKFKRLKKDAVPSKKIPVRQHEKPLKGNKM